MNNNPGISLGAGDGQKEFLDKAEDMADTVSI